MAGSPDNLLTPGLFADPDPSNPEAARIAGAQALVRGAGNLLWRGARGVAGDIWENLIKPPGEILSGERTPYAGYANSLDPAAYAGRVAGYGLGAGNLLGGAGEGVASQFGAWHGTRVAPFREFSTSPEHIATGAGAQTEGHGIYVAGEHETGTWYHEPGIDLTYNGEPWDSTSYKYFDPTDTFDHMGSAHELISTYNGDFKSAAEEAERAANIAYRNGDDKLGEHFDNVANWIDDNKDSIGVHLKGGLLRVHVKPEEEEFLDWDKPFSQQELGVQEGIMKSGLISKDDLTLMPIRDMQGRISRYSIDPTGAELYRNMVMNSWEKITGDKLDVMDFPDYFNDSSAYPVKEYVSKTLDAHGVVGNKYRQANYDQNQQIGRPVLKHKELFETAPDPEMAKRYLFGIGKDATVDDMLKGSLDLLDRHAKSLESNSLSDLISDFGESDGRLNFELAQANAAKMRDLIDWANKERTAGNFKVGDNINRNYVVFNPKNVEIRTWNGRPLEPMEEGYNPFDVTRP